MSTSYGNKMHEIMQGWNCRGRGLGLDSQFMSTDAHFLVKIGSKFQSLSKISNISTSDPSSCLQTLIFEWKSVLNFNLWARFQTFQHLTPSSCLQTLIFEWKSVLNFNPWARFQTFRHLTPSSCLQTLIFEWKSVLNFNPWAKYQTFRHMTQFF